MKNLSVSLRHDGDVGRTRQWIRQLAELLGLDSLTRTRVTAVVSALAYQWVSDLGASDLGVSNLGASDLGEGVVECWVEEATERSPRTWIIRFSRKETAVSPPGDACLGLPPALRERVAFVRGLVDGADIQMTTPRDTQIILQCPLPASPVATSPDLTRLAAEGLSHTTPEARAEMRHQDEDLICVLHALVAHEAMLQQFSRELDDTNRGVVALYTELEARADHLQRIEEAKSRFFSHMSHEFRVPINALLALCRLLLDQVDGPLTAEQTKQVTFIRREGESLAKLVDDLLDLARSEAGRITLAVGTFEVSALFNSLRNILKPLLQDSVELIFDPPTMMPPLETDEEKLTQILRNFISNALKYTSRGQVRVSATLSPDGETVTFAVSDTGIGIELEDQAVIFEAFTQIEHKLQQRVKGTGLGLSLCLKLAELLRGQITVESQPGRGSTFRLSLPRQYHHPAPHPDRAEPMMTPRLNVSGS